MNELTEGAVNPNRLLRSIVGEGAVLRTELNRRLWAYIRAKSRKDKKDPMVFTTDDPKLINLFGKGSIHAYDVAKAIEKNLGNKEIELGSIHDDIGQVLSDKSIPETEKEQLIQSRLGQGSFRSALIDYWKRCAATGWNVIALLRASHIKPWSLSSNKERLDPFNGLLLIPNLDAAFDKGMITFEDSGRIRLSPSLSKGDAQLLGIGTDLHVRFELNHQRYLKYHRENVFMI